MQREAGGEGSVVSIAVALETAPKFLAAFFRGPSPPAVAQSPRPRLSATLRPCDLLGPVRRLSGNPSALPCFAPPVSRLLRIVPAGGPKEPTTRPLTTTRAHAHAAAPDTQGRHTCLTSRPTDRPRSASQPVVGSGRAVDHRCTRRCNLDLGGNCLESRRCTGQHGRESARACVPLLGFAGPERRKSFFFPLASRAAAQQLPAFRTVLA